MDEQSIAFHERVRDAYKRLAAAEPNRLEIVDASPTPDVVEAAIWRLVTPKLESRRG
jgi:dTMP kinase